MKILFNVTVESLETKINRQILVDENIELATLCEFVIVSMNGEKILMYDLEYDEVTYYSYITENVENEKNMFDLTLKDLKLTKNSIMHINYNFYEEYCFELKVEETIKSDLENQKIDFKLLSGKGYGIMDNVSPYYLKKLLDGKNKRFITQISKNKKEYLQKKFDIKETNDRIEAYQKQRKMRFLPQKYIFNVSLEGFNKEIKRKIAVNSNIIIDDFCRNVILSMNGDLFHVYKMNINKEYLDEFFEDLELSYLDLKEKQRLKIIYDWGDGWQFNVTLRKIENGYGPKEFEVLSGKGYGIIDDCGGLWGLSRIFSGEDDSWGEYEINDFDVEKCNEKFK